MTDKEFQEAALWAQANGARRFRGDEREIEFFAELKAEAPALRWMTEEESEIERKRREDDAKREAEELLYHSAQ